jgi:hypothetical protein
MTRPYPQLGPFALARGEAGAQFPVAGLSYKGALVKLTSDETLVTSEAIAWDAQVEDQGHWWRPESNTIFVTPENVVRMSFVMHALLTPSVANMQFYMLKNGNRIDGAGYSQTDSGNAGFSFQSADLETVAGDVWEMIPEFAAGAPVLDSDEVGGTWLSIKAEAAVAPHTIPRGSLITLSADILTANYSAGVDVPFDAIRRDTDVFEDTRSLGLFRIPNSGIDHIRLRGQAGMDLVSSEALTTLEFLHNGVVLDPQVQGKDQLLNALPAPPLASYIIEVSSGDWLALNVTNPDTSISVIAARAWFEIEVINTNYLANVDSYHGIYKDGVTSQDTVMYAEFPPFNYTIPASLAGSTGFCGINPSAEEVWSFQKNDVEFATATIATDGAVTFQSSIEQEFALGVPDILTFVSPNSGTAGNISFLLKGLG